MSFFFRLPITVFLLIDFMQLYQKLFISFIKSGFLTKICHLFLPKLVISLLRLFILFSGWLWATYLLTSCSHKKNRLFFLPKLVIYFTKNEHFFYKPLLFFRLAMHNLLIDFMQPYQNLLISFTKLGYLLPKMVYYFAKIGHFFY